MLKTPPGIGKRRVKSKKLDEAGAVFEGLYKSYLSLDADTLQKIAENYLVNSLYNKTGLKNYPDSNYSDYSNTWNFSSSQSSNSECVVNPSDILNKTSHVDSNNNLKESKFVQKNQKSDTKDLKEDFQNLNEDLKDLKKDLRSLKDELKDSVKKNNTQTEFENNENNKPKKSESLKGTVRFKEELLSPSTKLVPSPKGKLKNHFKNKKLKEENEKDETRIFVEDSSESEISEDLYDNNTSLEKNYLTIEEISDSSNLDKVDEYLSPTNSETKKYLSRNSLLFKGKELTFSCTVCILFQILFSLVSLGIFFLIYSFPFYYKFLFVTILFPFVIHFGVYYFIFSLTDFRVKRTLLVYTNDITVDILSKRLNRELSYRKLNRCSTVAERVFILLGLVIACLPVNFNNDFKTFSFREYLYLGFILAYVLLHSSFTFYYFNVKFKKLLSYSSDQN